MSQKLKECSFDGSLRQVFIETPEREDSPAKMKILCLNCGKTSTTIAIEDAGGHDKAKELLTRLWNKQEATSAYWNLRRAATNIIRAMGGAFPANI